MTEERRIRVPMQAAEEALTFEMLPDDRSYTLEIDELEPREGEKGPYWNASLRVVDDEEYSGRILFDVWPIPREAVLNQGGAALKKEMKRSFRLWGFLSAAGYKWGELGFVAVDLIGLRAQSSLKVEVYQDKPRQRPDQYFST